MRPKIYMKDGDGEGSGDGRSGAAAKIVLPPLSCSPPAAKTKPEGAALSELPKMKRQTSMETMESGSKRIPSFRHRNTFRSSRQKDQKMKVSAAPHRVCSQMSPNALLELTPYIILVLLRVSCCVLLWCRHLA